MIREQCQKRPVQPPSSAAPPVNISCMPPKKRPRQLDYEAASVVAAPLDLSAKSTPMTVTNAEYSTPMLTPHQSMMLLTPPGLSAGQDAAQWQEAAAAATAMYAQYMTAYLNSLMPPPPPPPLPLLQPPSLPISPPSDKEAGRLNYGETDFRCSCGRHFANLVGLTVHMRTAGHRSAVPAVPSSSALDLPKAAEPSPPVAREMPKLVRGQDMWINSETEQTREILRCIRCRQSYRTLPELTMHMVRSRHYAEIISSAASTASTTTTATTPTTCSTSSLPSKRPQPQQLPRDGPAYLCPDLAPRAQVVPAPGAAAAAADATNPLSCLQRLVDKTAASSDAAPAASPSAASTSSTSEAASVIVVAAEDHQAGDDESAVAAPPSPTMPQAKQQQQQQFQKKKTKCQFCSRPFANKGQVRLHVSKGKCPGAGRAPEAQQHQQQQQHHQSPALFEYFLGGAATTRANPVWW